MSQYSKKINILFWKTVACIWNIRPRMHLPKYIDNPIASCDITDEYAYPDGVNILYEWDEKGRHWIVFSR